MTITSFLWGMIPVTIDKAVNEAVIYNEYKSKIWNRYENDIKAMAWSIVHNANIPLQEQDDVHQNLMLYAWKSLVRWDEKLGCYKTWAYKSMQLSMQNQKRTHKLCQRRQPHNLLERYGMSAEVLEYVEEEYGDN
jgi:DNA-directed RNA polymerase specialized sigma24 family protein